MSTPVSGIHHVTAISGPAQRNVNFYVGLLGLRLVKKTVNFDDPGTYHLYYGDRSGSPGSILTFFPWANALPGRSGAGMTAETSFVVPEGHLSSWEERFADALASGEFGKFDFDRICELDNSQRLEFRDPDGLPMALVERPVPAATSGGIIGFDGVTLNSVDAGGTARVLVEVLGYPGPKDVGSNLRFQVPGGEVGSVVDVASSDSRPKPGAGTVHHVAFRASSDEHQAELQDAVRSLGIPVTEVKDRNYFRSIYFREPGGVLFEIATDPPGFLNDESPETLGEHLKLPGWLESRRVVIEAHLPTLSVPTKASV